MIETQRNGQGNFITRDHKYVYLGGSLIALFGLSLWNSGATPYSFLAEGGVAGTILAAVSWLFLLVSLLALLVKWTHWNTYDETIMKHPVIVRISRYLSYLAVAAFLCFVADRVVLKLIYFIQYYMHAESNPASFFGSMVYMSYKGKSMLVTGIWTTIRIALLGTAMAFLLSILLVFLRIQKPDKRDNDFVKCVKIAASKFASLYVFVIRGTPMMVQALIFYFAGFALFKKTGMTVTQINEIWSFFISGLITVSLNSTAYLAEVLRGGIQAIDPGQMEAARSLGMTHWQAMMKVVFPQAVKNSIPAIGNEFIINIKDSSVLSVIGCSDLMFMTKSVAGIYYRALEIYVVAALLYLILTYLSSLLLKYLASKLETPAQGIPSSN